MKALFFCGHKSRYGRAHLIPLLDSRFEIDSIILATDARWKKFRNALNGTSYDSRQKCSFWLKFRNLPILISKKTRRLFGQPGQLAEKDVIDKSRLQNVDICWVEDVNSPDQIKQFKRKSPDLLISAAYPQIFGKSLLDIATVDAVNFHPSALPKFRGAHPHYWAIREGASQTGVTAHEMTTKLDKGQIISQRKFSCENISYKQLYNRIVEKTPSLVSDVESFYIDGVGEKVGQNEEEATYYKNDRTIHSRLFWRTKNCKELHNIVRTGKAFFFFNGEKVSVSDATYMRDNENVTNDIDVMPGTIVNISKRGIAVKAKLGYLLVKKLRYRRASCDPVYFARYVNLNIGQVFT